MNGLSRARLEADVPVPAVAGSNNMPPNPRRVSSLNSYGSSVVSRVPFATALAHSTLANVMTGANPVAVPVIVFMRP